MSIKWCSQASGTDSLDYVEETHVGLVVEGPLSSEEGPYCIIWNRSEQKAEIFDLKAGSSGGHPIDITVDIDPEIRKIWETEEKRAELEVLRVHRGMDVVVVRGRKVPKGTQGQVIWVGNKGWGPRVGVRDDKGSVHWTAESNVRVILPELLPGKVPRGGWQNYLERITQARKVWAKTFPKKGDKIVQISSGGVGTVFWVSLEGNVGFFHEGAPPGTKPTWCTVRDVQVQEENGNLRPIPPKWKEVLSATLRGERTDPTSTPADPVRPISELPHPLCLIRTVRKEGSRWSAYDERNNLIMHLTRAGAQDLLKWLK